MGCNVGKGIVIRLIFWGRSLLSSCSVGSDIDLSK